MNQFRQTAVGFRSDGKSLIKYGADGTLSTWEVVTGKKIDEFKGRKLDGHGSAKSADDKLIAVACGDGTISLIDATTGKERTVLRGHGGKDATKNPLQPAGKIVEAVAFSANGKLLVSGGQDNTARLWDVATGKQLAVFFGHTNGVFVVAISPDGKTIATGSYDKTVRLWDVGTKKLKATLKGHINLVTTMTFRGDGKVLASGCNHAAFTAPSNIILWDVTTGKELAKFDQDGAKVNTLLFSPDGDILATAMAEAAITLWDVRGK